MKSQQLSLIDIPFSGPDALDYFSESSGESRGEVFTKIEVVNFILDLTGWTEGATFENARLLEPSCGNGDFLVPAIERLLKAQIDQPIESLAYQIRGVEVNRKAFEVCRERVCEMLLNNGFSKKQTSYLVDAWLIHGDFLTTPLSLDFTHVIGNPPYLRQEALPDPLLKLYRSRFETMYDRADLYIPFYERGLTLLAPEGSLGFICADRWMKNKYGGPLRQFISEGYHLKQHVDFTGCPAFHDDVVAYPAVTIIQKTEGSVTLTASRPDVSSDYLNLLAAALVEGSRHPDVTQVYHVVDGSSPWLLDQPKRLEIIRRIETRFSAIEEADCQIGIGVASGADKVFIRPDDELPIESERKLPILLTRDVKNGEICWGGKMLMNPFDGDCPTLVDLAHWPLFSAYLEENKEAIMRRHVAKKNPQNWFKTIDRIYPSLTNTPKLLIPDIKGEATVVYDEGRFYPHHNFYYVVSQTWDLRALQAVLLSPVAQAFVATYSLRMRGDYLRYQAQYLRRIRIPNWEDISKLSRQKLIAAGRSQSPVDIKLAVQEVFGLSDQDWQILAEN